MKLYYFIPIFFLSCKSKTNKIENKITSMGMDQYWRVLKWNSKVNVEGILLLKFYSNYKYEFFSINEKKNRLISLKPDSLSDIQSYEFWKVKGDTILSFRKRVDFKFVNEIQDTLKFCNFDDSLIIFRYTLPSFIKRR